jgi:high-affinity K+ transport system ATPase subunit B
MKRFLSILTVCFLIAGVTLQVLKVFFDYENISAIAILSCLILAVIFNFINKKRIR